MRSIQAVVSLLVFYRQTLRIQSLQLKPFSVGIDRKTRSSHLVLDSCQSWRLRATSTPSPPEHAAADADDAASLPSMLDLLSPSPACRVEQMSSTNLAYIGDVLYELSVRSWAVWPPKRTSDLQNQVVELVRAEYQSELLRQLKADPEFGCTTTELQVLTRGRNSVSGSSRNRRDPSAYQDATAFEALLGYLFITDSDRCRTLLSWIRHRLV